MSLKILCKSNSEALMWRAPAEFEEKTDDQNVWKGAGEGRVVRGRSKGHGGR